ncbi:MTAP family purine nucleoside phosphorylase [Roseibium sp. SCP14]|uniref:MTAP family purine nucleoside phosphorylase n=1 Tax=Roseibium sp. SCP14 TaxID=3141375 RepID=UPI003336F248
MKTEYGEVDVAECRIAGSEFFQISRGKSNLAAHAINHRANIAALKQIGVTHIIGSAMVGSLHTGLGRSDLVLADQFLDFSKRTTVDFFEDQKFRDFDFTNPFSDYLRGTIASAAKELGHSLRRRGCYVGVDGPRFETAAEVRMYAQLGGDIIGMTIIPECTMSKQVGMEYAVIAGVVNPGAGLSPHAIIADQLLDARDRHLARISEIISRAVALTNAGVLETA